MERTNIRKAGRGFTLIEILVVIGIIAVLAAIVIIAINPAKQFAQARNSQRVSNVNSILNAVGQRLADNKGIFEGDFFIDSATSTCGVLPDGSPRLEVKTDEASNTTSQTGDLGCLVPTYLPALPFDPVDGSGNDTGYFIEVNNVGRVTVCAPSAANETAIPGVNDEICVTR